MEECGKLDPTSVVIRKVKPISVIGTVGKTNSLFCTHLCQA